MVIIVSNSRGKFCQLEQILCLALVDPVISTCVRLHIIQRYEHHTRAYKIMQTLMVKLKSWSTFFQHACVFSWRCSFFFHKKRKKEKSKDGEFKVERANVRNSVFLSRSQLWISPFRMAKKQKRKPEFSKRWFHLFSWTDTEVMVEHWWH